MSLPTSSNFCSRVRGRASTLRSRAGGRASTARFHGLSAILLLLSGAGCGADKLISLGRQGGGIDLQQCKGGNTDCGASSQSRAIPVGTAKECPTEVTAQLEVDFQVNLSEKLCRTNRCQANLDAMAVDDAGSVWVLAQILDMVGDNPSTLWLGHFGPTGEELGASTIVADVNLQGGGITYEKDLALGANGQAFVFVYEQTSGPTADDDFSERSWIQAYNPDLTRAGAPIPLAELGEAHLAASVDGNIVVTGNAPQNAMHGLLGAITHEGELQWSRNDLASVGRGVGIGVASVAVDASGAISVLAVREQDVQKQDQTLGIGRYSAEGQMLWDRDFDTLYEAGTWPAFAGDANGNLTVLGDPKGAFAGQTTDEHIWLQNVGASGDLRWTYRLSQRGPMAVGRESGRVFIGGDWIRPDVGPPIASLFEISSDGNTCKRYGFSGVEGVGVLVAMPSDQLYFLSGGSVGRFRPFATE